MVRATRSSSRGNGVVKFPRRTLSLGFRAASNILLKRPLAISVEVTHACNAKCRHCHLGGPVKEDRASPRVYSDICRKVKPTIVQFSGGEPLLRRDLEDIVAAVHAPNRAPYIVVTTNAALLSRKRHEQLSAAGVDEFSISLDYPDERHDAFRGIPGLFGRIKALVESFDGAEEKAITLSCVIQSDNFRDLVRMADLAREWNVGLNFSTYTPLRTRDRGYMIPQKNLEEFREITRKLVAFKKARDTIFTSEYLFKRMVTYFKLGCFPGCRTGARFCNVNPDGTFSPCGLIITNFRTLKELKMGFAKTNTCIHCLTSSRSNCEKPIGRLIWDALRSR